MCVQVDMNVIAPPHPTQPHPTPPQHNHNVAWRVCECVQVDMNVIAPPHPTQTHPKITIT